MWGGVGDLGGRGFAQREKCSYFVHICSYLFICVQICSYLVIFVHMCSYLFSQSCGQMTSNCVQILFIFVHV